MNSKIFTYIKNVLIVSISYGLSGSALASYPGFQHWVHYGNSVNNIDNLVLNASGTPYIYDTGNTIRVRTLRKNIWVPAGPTISTTQFGISLAINAEKKDSTPYVSYMLANANGLSLYVDHLVNKQWVHVGNAAIRTQDMLMTGYYSLVIADNQKGISVPYVLFETPIAGYHVDKFNGKNWVQVGNSIQASSIDSTAQLVLDTNGTPFLALPAGDNDGIITIMKLVDNTWQTVGPAIQNYNGNGFTLAVNPITHTPYVAYLHTDEQDPFFPFGYAKVVGFDPETDEWETIGGSLKKNQYELPNVPALTFSSTGQTYIAFQSEDYTTGYSFNNVMRLNLENQWIMVGNRERVKHSSNAYEFNSLILDSNNKPFYAHTQLRGDDQCTVETLSN